MPKRIPGIVIWVAALGLTGFGTFGSLRFRHVQVEDRTADHTIRAVAIPYLQAESDRAHLALKASVHSKEAALMVRPLRCERFFVVWLVFVVVAGWRLSPWPVAAAGRPSLRWL